MWGGRYLFVWGSESIDKKKVALDGRRLKYFHATTKQKHAVVIDNGTKEGYKLQGVGRKRDSII